MSPGRRSDELSDNFIVFAINLEAVMTLGILAFLGGIVIGLAIGGHIGWSWNDFWVNFISNAVSGGIIGLLLYVAITQPDEKKARKKRLRQALGMLKTEFEINLERSKQYANWLKSPQASLETLYPFRFTRGAWNALKESGFLPQLEDTRLVYRLLKINEVFVVANSSLVKVRNAWVEDDQDKITAFSKKAQQECEQITQLSQPLLDILTSMDLPRSDLDEDYILPEDTTEING